jgi:hypothetical protein
MITPSFARRLLLSENLLPNLNLPLLALCLVVLSACSSTKLTDSWQAPTLHRADMDNVLVVAITTNMTNRILFERGFVEALKQRGINATASIDAIGTSAPTRESVTAYLKTSDMHYVVATRYAGAEVQKYVVPEQVRTYYTGPYYPTYGAYWDSYNTITMTRDAYVDTTTTVVLNTSIFEVKTEALVWVGRSKTFEVGSIAYEANDLAHAMVDRITK